MNNTEHINMSDVMMIERPYDQRPIFKVSWKMTNLCPYHCEYCYMSDAVAKAKMCKDNPTQEETENIASHIDEMLLKLSNPKDEVQFHLIGGEPSIFDLEKILDKVKDDRLKYISVASNIYRPYKYWESLKMYCKSRGANLGVSASFHLTQLNEKQLDEYCEKVIGLKFQCKAVVNNENLEKYKKYFELFMKNNIAIEITVERDFHNTTVDISEENQKYIDYIRNYQYTRKEATEEWLPYYIVTLKNGRKIGYSSNISLINCINEGHLDTTNFYCTAGIHNVRMEKNGDLKRSACRLCSSFYRMGNILIPDSYSKVEDMVLCDCNMTDEKGIQKEKYCTAFNNTSMYRKGYDKLTGILS